MRPIYPSDTRVIAICAALILTIPATAGEPGKMTREVWTNITGSLLTTFTNSPRYWQPCTSVATIIGTVGPINAGNSFAARYRAYITAPVTGNYTFWIASDDDSELRLASGEVKFDRVKIASVTGYVNPQAWDAKTSQKSAAIPLVAGQRYFIEALHKDSTGGDHLSIAWQLPGGARELIPASALESFTVEPNDTDNDDLPDTWETAHGFSLTDSGTLYPSQHPLADPDHDGYSNLQESTLGTDPVVFSGEPGKMTREVWWNLTGGKLTDFTGSARYWQAAGSVSKFPGSTAPQNIGDYHASRIRAFVTPPVTGNYVFWIASDDDSELYLSTNKSKFGRVKIAFNSGWVNPMAWDAKSSQMSVQIPLTAGEKYFIEALHKDHRYDDHLAISWQQPGGTRELIPSSALESFSFDSNDIDNDELKDDWETVQGYSVTDNGTLHPQQHPLADPDRDGYSNLEECAFGTNPTVRGGVPGSLLLETWHNLPGSTVESLTWSDRFTGSPDISEFIFSAETPVDRGDNFGARMRGYVIAPVSGDYIFYLAGDDSCELWLSPSGGQFAKQKSAAVERYTSPKQWNKYPAQKSQVFTLQAGQRVYVEAIQKETTNGDHMEIGWIIPGTTSIAVIPGSALESYAYDVNDADGDNLPDDWEIVHGLSATSNDASADPDKDHISNLIEWVSNSDPQMKNAIQGALLHELWWNVPSERIHDFVSSNRMLQEPDLVSLAPSAQGPVNIGDGYGNRLRGYLTAPVTGTYTFWAAGDEAMEFWLSTSENKLNKELLVRPAIVTQNYDADISLKSRAVTLVAGQKYYLEMLHVDGHSADYCEVAWQRPGANREIIPGSVLTSYIPTADDMDDDGLPDGWETDNGLSPADNGSINSQNGFLGDLDGDGLSNSSEFKAGTRADLSDTDGDGVNDGDEIEMMETQALTADAAPFESVAVIPGASYTAASGNWIQDNGKARQDCVRGWLEYPITLATAGVYQLHLIFTPIADAAASPEYEIVFAVDGKNIHRETATVVEATSGHAKVLSPWLTAGDHTIRVFIDNSRYFRRVTVDELRILAARGQDDNNNAKPDWIDLRLAKFNTIEAPAESLTSPVCLEGKAKWSELSSINGITSKLAPDDRWYVDVPLDATQPTEVIASLENGALTATRQISWVPTNLLNTGTLTIRLGDSLKLSAFTGTAGTNEETVILTVEGQTTTITADQSLVHIFTTPGSVPVQVTHSHNGSLTTATANINVVAAPVVASPVCVVDNYREFNLPAASDALSLQHDSRIEFQSTAADNAGGHLHILRLNTLDDRMSVFRLGGNTGPIVGCVSFRAMRIRAGAETAVLSSAGLGTNNWELTMPVVVDGNYPGVTITLDIFIGGVIFEDGMLTRTILPESYSDFCWSELVKFFKTGNQGSNCHRTSVKQNGIRIAYFQ